MRKQHLFFLWGIGICLSGLSSCTGPEEVDSTQRVKANVGQLVSIKEEEPQEGPGEYAFFNFLQQVAHPTEDDLDTALEKEAALFFPDSTFHPGYALHGLEIPYLDSIRLLYYEFSKNDPPQSRAYLGVFSKSGKALDVLPLKEATYDGNAAVTLIDQSTLELEYYNIYDAEGYQEDVLTFEYYDLGPNGRLRPLSRPEQVSDGRKYLEASLRLLSRSELEKYKPRELRMMQLEVLADYGQIFDSPRWRRYFKRQYWYTPRHSKVDHLLSDLEKVNLAKIAEIQKAY